MLQGNTAQTRDAVFYEQEETRAIRTHDWLYAMRFQGAAGFPMQDEIYDLKSDPLERTNLIDDPALASVATTLRSRVTEFFQAHSQPHYDLWNRGTAKSNVTYARLWKDAWGEDWAPEHSVGPGK